MDIKYTCNGIQINPPIDADVKLNVDIKYVSCFPFEKEFNLEISPASKATQKMIKEWIENLPTED